MTVESQTQAVPHTHSHTHDHDHEHQHAHPHHHHHHHQHSHTQFNPAIEAQKNLKTKQLLTSDSSFSNSKIATGAAISFIDEVKERIPQNSYNTFLAILNTYYQTHSTIPQVYEQVRVLFEGADSKKKNADLIEKFQKFLPLEVVEVAEEEDDGSTQNNGGESTGRFEEIDDNDDDVQDVKEKKVESVNKS